MYNSTPINTLSPNNQKLTSPIHKTAQNPPYAVHVTNNHN